jgi:hypothetical protein
MDLLKAILNWMKRKANSDIHKIKITSNGGFYMKSEDLFSDKEKSLELLNKLDKLDKIRTI